MIRKVAFNHNLFSVLRVVKSRYKTPLSTSSKVNIYSAISYVKSSVLLLSQLVNSDASTHFYLSITYIRSIKSTQVTATQLKHQGLDFFEVLPTVI